MQSKTSCFNKFLYFKTLLRFWPLWTVASIGGCILSVIMVESNFNRFEHSIAFSKYILCEEAVNLFPWVAFFYAIAVAMCVWGYLYQKSSNFHYHSMPITRDGLFLTSFAAGVTITWIPFVISAVVQIAVLTAVTVISVPDLLFAIASALVNGLFFFTVATLISFITSNIVALPVLYFILNILEFIIYGLTSSLARGFYPGVSTSGDSVLSFLSPLVWIITTMNFSYQYDYDNGYYCKLSEIEVTGRYVLIVLLVASVVLVFASLVAYKTKRNEDVGTVISIKWLRPVLLVIITYASALCFSEFVWIISTDFAGDSFYSIPIMSMLFVIGGGITFFVGLMILSKTTKVFNKRSILSFAGISVLLVLLCLTLGTDWLHIARKLPARTEIESAKIEIAGTEYKFFENEHSEYINMVYDLNKVLVTESEEIKKASYIRNNGTANSEYINVSVTIQYVLKDGKTVTKYYYLACAESDMNNPASYVSAIDNFINSDIITLYRVFEDSNYKLTGINVNDYNGEYVEISGSEMEELVEAVSRDIVENHSFRFHWFEAYQCYECSLEFVLANADRNNASVNSEYRVYEDYRWFALETDMTNTVNWLSEHGYISEKTLNKESHQNEKSLSD